MFSHLRGEHEVTQSASRGSLAGFKSCAYRQGYKFEKITEGVYYATATGSLVTGSNNVAIVGSRDVLVVDTGTTPAAARAFIDDLKLVTTKPVRYVVNTHFHYDHTDVNQVYAGIRKQGVTADAAAQRLDLTAYRSSFPQIQGRGAEVRGVQLLYAWMEEQSKK